MARPRESTRRPRARFADGDRARRVRRALTGERAVRRMTRTFRALGDPTRARVLLALSVAELCVGDLARLLGVSSSVISHQMRALKDLELVRPRRQGRSTYYSLDNAPIRALFVEGLRQARAARGGRA